MQAHQYKWFSSKDGGPFPPESAQGAEHMTAVPIFEDCEEKFVNSLSRHLLKCEVKKGDYLARAGEIGDKMWLVRKGSVDFVDPSGSGMSRALSLPPPSLLLLLLLHVCPQLFACLN